MTRKQEEILKSELKNSLRDQWFQGLKTGAKGILGTVLDSAIKEKC